MGQFYNHIISHKVNHLNIYTDSISCEGVSSEVLSMDLCVLFLWLVGRFSPCFYYFLSKSLRTKLGHRGFMPFHASDHNIWSQRIAKAPLSLGPCHTQSVCACVFVCASKFIKLFHKTHKPSRHTMNFGHTLVPFSWASPKTIHCVSCKSTHIVYFEPEKKYTHWHSFFCAFCMNWSHKSPTEMNANEMQMEKYTQVGAINVTRVIQ